MGQIFLQVFQLSPVSTIPPMLYNDSVTLSSTLCNLKNSHRPYTTHINFIDEESSSLSFLSFMPRADGDSIWSGENIGL